MSGRALDAPSGHLGAHGSDDRRFLLVAVAIAAVVFVLSWSALAWLWAIGTFGSLDITDLGLYQTVAADLLHGAVPYRDFALEYPPLSLPVFALPALLPSGVDDLDVYKQGFFVAMAASAVLALVAIAVGLRALGASRARFVLALGFVAVSPILVGPVITSRYDLWPAALLSAALASVLTGRTRLGSVLLGLAGLAKLYPFLVAPLFIAYAWKRWGRREGLISAAIIIGTATLVAVPFVVASPSGVWDVALAQLERPLQLESVGSALLIVARDLAGLDLRIETSFGSRNLAGDGTSLAATFHAVVLVVAMVGVFGWFVRGRPNGPRLVRGCAAVVCAAVAFGKVLSPQYVIWLIPLVPLVTGRRGLAALGTLAVALLLTVAFFPRRYPDLEALQVGAASIVLLRDLALVALFLVLVLPWSWLLARTRALGASLARRFPRERYAPSPLAALGLVLLVALFLRAIWLNLPSGSLIFDETYYVNAARVMLGWPVMDGAPYATAPAFIDPNAEHPPLGKALIAASMLVLGDTGIAWRLPSVVAGMVALVALYGIVRAAGGHPWLAVLAVTLYSVDVLSFVHGRIATLDMMAVGLMLVGAWLGLRRHWLLAGSAMALATLVKLPSAYGLLAMLAWQGIGLWRAQRRGEPIAWPEIRPVAVLLLSYGVVFLVGLWLLDLRFTTHTNPLDHVQAMLRYGFGLQPSYDPNTIASAPWDWLVNGGQFDYLKVAVDSLVNGEVVGSATTVRFRGLMNPVIIGAASLTILYALWRSWHRLDRVARWSVVWMAATYLPYWLLNLVSNRITYLYYVLPIIPALAAATAVFLFHARLPRFVVAGFIIAAMAAFAASFPFRAFP